MRLGFFGPHLPLRGGILCQKSILSGAISPPHICASSPIRSYQFLGTLPKTSLTGHHGVHASGFEFARVRCTSGDAYPPARNRLVHLISLQLLQPGILYGIRTSVCMTDSFQSQNQMSSLIPRINRAFGAFSFFLPCLPLMQARGRQ